MGYNSVTDNRPTIFMRLAVIGSS